MAKFKPGESGNPSGRPKGSRSKLTEDFLSVLQADFNEHGAEAVIKMREEDNTQYVKTIASLMPRDHNINVNEFDDLSLDELIRRANTQAANLQLLGLTARDKAETGSEQTH
jgi:predicted transcriptional regulator